MFSRMSTITGDPQKVTEIGLQARGFLLRTMDGEVLEVFTDMPLEARSLTDLRWSACWILRTAEGNRGHWRGVMLRDHRRSVPQHSEGLVVVLEDQTSFTTCSSCSTTCPSRGLRFGDD